MRARTRGVLPYWLMGGGAVAAFAITVVSGLSPTAVALAWEKSVGYTLVLLGAAMGMIFWARAKPEDLGPDPAWVARRTEEFRERVRDHKDADPKLARALRESRSTAANEVILGRWKGAATAVRARTYCWLVLTSERLLLVPMNAATYRPTSTPFLVAVGLREASDPKQTNFRLNPPAGSTNFEVGGRSIYMDNFSIQEATEGVLAARRVAGLEV